MRVGSNDQAAGKCVIFQHDLMNDPGTRLPEPNTVLLGCRGEKIIDLLVLVHRTKQVLLGTHLSTDQVVAMDGARHGHLLLVGLHELQHGHLGCCVLHRNTIRTQSQHRLAALPGLGVEIVGV